MPEKSQQFMTDEFGAQRAQEANQAKLATGAAIGQGIASGVQAFQQQRQQTIQNEMARRELDLRRDTAMANLALRHRDMEVSTHAQAFGAMLQQQEMAERVRNNTAEIALKTEMQRSYQERTAQLADKAALNAQVKMAAETARQLSLQNDANEFMLKQQKLALEQESAAGRQSQAVMKGLTDLYGTVINELSSYRDDPAKAPKKLLDSLDRLRSATMSMGGLQAPRSEDPEGDAKQILGVQSLPQGVGGEDADIEATLSMFGRDYWMQKIAAEEPEALLEITKAIRANADKMRSGAGNQLTFVLGMQKHLANLNGDWRKFVKDLNEYRPKQGQ